MLWNILFISVFIGLGNAQVHKLMINLNPIISKIMEAECLANSSLNIQKIVEIEEKLIKPNPETIEQMRCIPLCVFSKLGILDANGNFNPQLEDQKFTIRLNHRQPEDINECMKNGVDSCDKANRFTYCILEDDAPKEEKAKNSEDATTKVVTQPNVINSEMPMKEKI